MVHQSITHAFENNLRDAVLWSIWTSQTSTSLLYVFAPWLNSVLEILHLFENPDCDARQLQHKTHTPWLQFVFSMFKFDFFFKYFFSYICFVVCRVRHEFWLECGAQILRSFLQTSLRWKNRYTPWDECQSCHMCKIRSKMRRLVTLWLVFLLLKRLINRKNKECCCFLTNCLMHLGTLC